MEMDFEGGMRMDKKKVVSRKKIDEIIENSLHIKMKDLTPKSRKVWRHIVKEQLKEAGK